MFSKLMSKFQHSTALNLTLRFTILFGLSSIALFITVDLLLSKAQKEKEQQLINSFMEIYQSLDKLEDLHKIKLVLKRDEPYFQRSNMRVELRTMDNDGSMLIQPKGWPTTPIASWLDESKDSWKNTTLIGSQHPLLYRQTTLFDGSQLLIAMSTLPGELELTRSRNIVVAVMVPLVLLSLVLTAYMNWLALRPVHDLIETVKSLHPTDLQARVVIRNPRSELGELALLFNTMLIQIENLIVAMQHSLDAIGHDLRTPLSRMRLSIESALTEGGKEKLYESLLDCAEESERIEVMLKSLMDISEAESGTLKMYKEQVNVLEIVAQCVDLYQYSADDADIGIKIISKEPKVVIADRVRLQQILGNLIDNAIKYNRPKGEVSISWRSSLENLELSITDQGIGISPTDQEKVFNRLYRSDNSRGKPGIGLGLSLVRAIVRAHDGKVKLKSQLGKGTKVTVYLPLKDLTME